MYFWTGSWKLFSHIWNQYRQICLIVKFHEKATTPKLGIKNALFGYFCARISNTFSHIWNQPRQICVIGEFCRKIKILNFVTENDLFGYSCTNILKKPLSYTKSATSNLSHCKVLYKKSKILRFRRKNANFGARF